MWEVGDFSCVTGPYLAALAGCFLVATRGSDSLRMLGWNNHSVDREENIINNSCRSAKLLHVSCFISSGSDRGLNIPKKF